MVYIIDDGVGESGDVVQSQSFGSSCCSVRLKPHCSVRGNWHRIQNAAPRPSAASLPGQGVRPGRGEALPAGGGAGGPGAGMGGQATGPGGGPEVAAGRAGGAGDGGREGGPTHQADRDVGARRDVLWRTRNIRGPLIMIIFLIIPLTISVTAPSLTPGETFNMIMFIIIIEIIIM